MYFNGPQATYDSSTQHKRTPQHAIAADIDMGIDSVAAAATTTATDSAATGHTVRQERQKHVQQTTAVIAVSQYSSRNMHSSRWQWQEKRAAAVSVV